MSYGSLGGNFGTRTIDRALARTGQTREQAQVRLAETERVAALQQPSGLPVFYIVGAAAIVGLFIYMQVRKK